MLVLLPRNECCIAALLCLPEMKILLTIQYVGMGKVKKLESSPQTRPKHESSTFHKCVEQLHFEHFVIIEVAACDEAHACIGLVKTRLVTKVRCIAHPYAPVWIQQRIPSITINT